MENKIKSGLFGLAVGDALGVPVEFQSRAYLKQNAVSDMFVLEHIISLQEPGAMTVRLLFV